MNFAPLMKPQFFDSNGDPLVGGKLYTYLAGTTQLASTYQDMEGNSNTNPIVLDSRGECDIYLGALKYKFVLKDADDVEIWSVDNVSSSNRGMWPAAKYTNSAGTAQTATGVAKTVPWGNKVFDNYNAMSADTFTVPAGQGGLYSISVLLGLTTSASSSASILDAYLVLSSGAGINYRMPRAGSGYANSFTHGVAFGGVFYLPEGATVKVQFTPTFSGGTGDPVYLLADASANQISIAKIGELDDSDSPTGVAPSGVWLTHTLTDGQSATDLSNETVDSTYYSTAEYQYVLKRGTTVFSKGILDLNYRNGAWELVQGPDRRADAASDHGVTFSISGTTTAQLQAAADSGAGNGTLKLKRILVGA